MDNCRYQKAQTLLYQEPCCGAYAENASPSGNLPLCHADNCPLMHPKLLEGQTFDSEAPNANAVSLVFFQSLLDEDETPSYGILFDNGFVLALESGSYFEPEDCEILRGFDGFSGLNDTLVRHYQA